MKVSELTKLAGLQPDDEVLIVRNDVGPGLAPQTSSVSRAFSLNPVEQAVQEALLRAWPVGCYYKGTEDPTYTIGGSWTEIRGRYLYAMESGSTAGSTGGSETVTLTNSSMPSHNHSHTLSLSGGGHQHTLTPVSHTHTMPAHQHSFTPANHRHTVPAHTHTAPDHRHRLYNTTSCYVERTDIGAGNFNGFKGRVWQVTNSAVYTPTSQMIIGEASNNPETGTFIFDTIPSTTTTSSCSATGYTITASSSTLNTSEILNPTFSSSTETVAYSNNAGGGVAHTNMPPTEVCRIWRRVS